MGTKYRNNCLNGIYFIHGTQHKQRSLIDISIGKSTKVQLVYFQMPNEVFFLICFDIPFFQIVYLNTPMWIQKKKKMPSKQPTDQQTYKN